MDGCCNSKKRIEGSNKTRIIIVNGTPVICSSGSCNSFVSGEIAEVFSQRKRPQETFFPKEKLITSVSDDGNMFLNKTHYSDGWGIGFAHGADMIPAMVEGFSLFLAKRGVSLQTLKKIKFKKATHGDLLYSITSQKDTTLATKANVVGEFEDNKSNIYHFYAHEKTPEKMPPTCINILPKEILGYEHGHCLVKFAKDTPKDKTRLRDKSDCNTGPYKEKMLENEGYVWAIITDIVNLVYCNKLHMSGLVGGYDNLTIYKDRFLPADIFDGSCTLETEILGTPRQVGRDLWYRCAFSLIHDKKGEVLKGETNFLAH